MLKSIIKVYNATLIDEEFALEVAKAEEVTVLIKRLLKQWTYLKHPEQRKFMYDKVREFRDKKPIFLMDFWNDGEYVDGYIAGGKNYLHINANGDVEPCAFIHYSNVNIKDTSLLDALKSPIFQQFNKRQPFNSNHLRPCPLLDNPEILREMIHESNAHSTQPQDEEDVDDLFAKCEIEAEKWAVTANELWEKSQNK